MELLSEQHREGWAFVPEIGYFIPRSHVSIINEVKAEVADPEYAGRTHGRPATRNAGCKGPLCKKALRDRMRPARRKLYDYQVERRSRVRDLDPLLDVLMEKMLRETCAAA